MKVAEILNDMRQEHLSVSIREEEYSDVFINRVDTILDNKVWTAINYIPNVRRGTMEGVAHSSWNTP